MSIMTFVVQSQVCELTCWCSLVTAGGDAARPAAKREEEDLVNGCFRKFIIHSKQHNRSLNLIG